MTETKNSIPRMRTVQEAAQELKTLDVHTAVTSYHIRRLCLEGIIPTVRAGKKILLNLDTLIEYLTNPDDEKFQTRPASTFGGIKRIS